MSEKEAILKLGSSVQKKELEVCSKLALQLGGHHRGPSWHQPCHPRSKRTSPEPMGSTRANNMSPWHSHSINNQQIFKKNIKKHQLNINKPYPVVVQYPITYPYQPENRPSVPPFPNPQTPVPPTAGLRLERTTPGSAADSSRCNEARLLVALVMALPGRAPHGGFWPGTEVMAG